MSDPLLVAALLLAGLILIAVELVLVPGFGFFGVAGLGVLITGFFLSFAKLGGEQTLYLVITTTMLAGILAWWAARAGVWKRLIHSDSQAGSTSQQQGIDALVGMTGSAHSTLRPAGVATIDGRRVDVVAEGGFVEKGQEIEVLRVDGNRVVVRRFAAGDER